MLARLFRRDAFGLQSAKPIGIWYCNTPYSSGICLRQPLAESGFAGTDYRADVSDFCGDEPLGFVTSSFISKGLGDISLHFDKIMAVVIGIFLHISTTILLESGSADHHKFNKRKMIAICLGILVSLTGLLFPTHDHSHHDEHHHHEHHHHEHHGHDHDHDHNH